MSSSQGSHQGAAIADVEECRRRRRLLLKAGEAIKDDETARQKMRDARVYERGVIGTFSDPVGFDPDNLGDVKSYHSYPFVEEYNVIKPMGYFAFMGDLPMMRWLYVNGADTRDAEVPVWFPMWAAARNGNGTGRCICLICKWLFEHGAAEDIKRPTRIAESFSIGVTRPLNRAFSPLRQIRRNLIRWFILNGALCKDDNLGDLDVEKMKADLDSIWGHMPRRRVRTERAALLTWANDLHRARYSFLLFLSGSLTAPRLAQPAGSPPRTVSPLQCFGGVPEVLEQIGRYAGHRQYHGWSYDAGLVRGREARIIRQLTELLPGLPFLERRSARY